MKPITFGNGKEKTLADLAVGDQIAITDPQGDYKRMGTIKRKTRYAVWTGTSRFGERFDLSGNQIGGNNKCRIPTPADKKRYAKQKAKARKLDAVRRQEQRCREQEEYRLAQAIGYELLDADHGTPEEYLAFAKRIGLETLRAFNDSIEEAKA